jgi:hypothetical protein
VTHQSLRCLWINLLKKCPQCHIIRQLPFLNNYLFLCCKFNYILPGSSYIRYRRSKASHAFIIGLFPEPGLLSNYSPKFFKKTTKKNHQKPTKDLQKTLNKHLKNLSTAVKEIRIRMRRRNFLSLFPFVICTRWCTSTLKIRSFF